MMAQLETHDILIEATVRSDTGAIYPVLYSDDTFAIYLKGDGSTHKVDFKGDTAG